MSKRTPFEEAVFDWIFKLPETWTAVTWGTLTNAQERAFVRLVKGGFIEGQLPTELRLQHRDPIHIDWRVTGAFGPVLEQHIREYLRSIGEKGAGVMAKNYVAARLTADGALAKREFKGDHPFRMTGDEKARLPEFRVAMVTGGPDGEEGIEGRGSVHMETESVVRSASTATSTSPPKQITTTPASRSMTQDDVDQAIAAYKANRAANYGDLRAAVRANKPGAVKAAREVFGRNVVARKIGCKSGAMVSKSPVYVTIQAELKLERRKRLKPQRTGLQAAADSVSGHAGDTTFDAVTAKETRQLVLRHLAPTDADEVLRKLELGEMTDTAARMLVEAQQEQRRDSKSRRVPSDP